MEKKEVRKVKYSTYLSVRNVMIDKIFKVIMEKDKNDNFTGDEVLRMMKMATNELFETFDNWGILKIIDDRKQKDLWKVVYEEWFYSAPKKYRSNIRQIKGMMSQAKIYVTLYPEKLSKFYN